MTIKQLNNKIELLKMCEIRLNKMITEKKHKAYSDIVRYRKPKTIILDGRLYKVA